MNYLIVSATVLEVKPLLDHWDLESPNIGETTVYEVNDHSVTFLIGGIGMMAMAFNLGVVLQTEKFDLVMNVGIAGSFKENLEIGDLVVVKSQCYADLGASNADGYEDVFELGLLNENEFPFDNCQIVCEHISLLNDYVFPEVTAISVNNVSGNSSQIELLENKYNPQIEVMEGIAVHYACSMMDVPYLEIRAISNYVEVRNKENWKIKEAIETLNDFLIEWFNS